MIKILGKCLGVEFVARGEHSVSEYVGKEKDKHIVIQLLVEDDGIWHKVGNGFSSFWLDDLIEVLNKARKILDTMPEDNGVGHKFK